MSGENIFPDCTCTGFVFASVLVFVQENLDWNPKGFDI